MASCAAIASGVLDAPGPSNPGFVQLYYTTNASKRLGLSIRSGSVGDERERQFGPSSKDAPGTMIKMAHLGAARYKDTNIVVGMQQHWDAATSSLQEGRNDVCMLSPVFQCLASTEQANMSIAICADNRQAAWVYYLQ
jgi:hypothetical protein